MDRIVLLYFPSRHIVEYITKHRIDWADAELARRGGDGDKAGIPPTPSVQEFLALLRETGALFSQEEYWAHCVNQWQSWINKVMRDPMKRNVRVYEGLRAKAYRNFYPAMIDALHVWALLCETSQFDCCFLDSYLDATGKSDITVVSGAQECNIALIGPTKQAIQDRAYKETHRSGYESANRSIIIRMPIERKREPGNKRWYQLADFEPVYKALAIPYFKTTTQLPNTPLFTSNVYDLGA